MQIAYVIYILSKLFSSHFSFHFSLLSDLLFSVATASLQFCVVKMGNKKNSVLWCFVAQIYFVVESSLR